MGCAASKPNESMPSRTAKEPPAGSFAALFFDGRPAASKVEEMIALMDDSFKLAFVGPYAGATTGMIMDKEMVPKALGALAGANPDFTFNPEEIPSPPPPALDPSSLSYFFQIEIQISQ